MTQILFAQGQEEQWEAILENGSLGLEALGDEEDMIDQLGITEELSATGEVTVDLNLPILKGGVGIPPEGITDPINFTMEITRQSVSITATETGVNTATEQARAVDCPEGFDGGRIMEIIETAEEAGMAAIREGDFRGNPLELGSRPPVKLIGSVIIEEVLSSMEAAVKERLAA